MATFFSGYFLAKVGITALIVAGISELTKHTSILAAILASLPLTSVLALVWMQVEGQPTGNMELLSRQVFWMVIPSLVFFVVFPLLLRQNITFYPALLIACGSTAIAYGLMLKLLDVFGKTA